MAVQVPAWPDTTAKDETYIVADETAVIGDEADGAELLINLLFGTTHTLIDNVPPTATPLSPTLDTGEAGRLPTFHWLYDDPDGYLQHRFQVQVHDRFGRLVAGSGEVSSAAREWTPPVALPYGHLMWRVRAHDGFEWGEWSNLVSFVTETQTIEPATRYAARVRVYRAGEWVDITHRVASGVIRESNDQPVATLELRLLNGREYDSLAPRRKDSPLNRVNDQYVPLLWIGRLIAVEAAFSEDGSEPDEWWPVFLGELDDEIDTESGPDGTYVRLFCRDMAARLQRAYIAGPWTFENMYASQMIQAILDHAYSEGLIQEPVQLRLIGPDDFWVERYDIEYTDLWSALQRFCQQRGTDLRYRLNEQTGQIELTYWLPDRAMVPGWIIDASQVRREELRISGTDIINRVTVRYRDAQTGQRAEVTVQDEDSIAMYGLRYGLIEEPDTDLIPDQETAQKLAQTIVDDLKDVPALTRITCPFDPRIQLFDKLRVANPSVRDEPEDYAVEARELSFTATDWSMVLVGGGRVVVKRQAWLERLATEGVKQPFTPRDTVTARGMSKPTGVAVTSIRGGIAVRFDPPVGEEYMRWWESEVHISTQANFTPGPATKVASGRYTYFELTQGLQPNTTYYVRIIHVDMSLNKSEPSDVASGQIAPITEGVIDPSMFAIVPTSDPAPSSGSLEDLWDMDPNTGCTFPSAPITITFKYPVYQGSDVIELHLSANAQGYVQMRQRDTGQWINILGSSTSPMSFVAGWNYQRFAGNRLYFGREYRLVLLQNVRINELRFERVTVADRIIAAQLSAISANMGTVTAGIVQTPDGRAKFGEGALGSDKHGMLVSDGTQDRVVVGDISGRMWRGQPLPQGTYGIYVSKGAGYFAGELDAEIIRSENIDIAFAQVVSVIGGAGNWSIEHVATSKDDWNIIKGENALNPNTDGSIVSINHSTLSTLIGSLIVEISGDGFSWLSIGQTPYNEISQYAIGGNIFTFGHLGLSPNRLDFAYRRVVPGGTDTDLWIRFRRHAIR